MKTKLLKSWLEILFMETNEIVETKIYLIIQYVTVCTVIGHTVIQMFKTIISCTYSDITRMKFCLVCCRTIPRPLLNIQEWVFNASMIVVSFINDESSCSFILYQFKIYLINSPPIKHILKR